MTAVPGFGMPIVASYFPPEAEQRAMRDMDARLRAFAAESFSRPVHCSVTQGTHWKRIVDTATEKHIDLIVMPHCDKDWPESMLLGSCAQKVTERAPCSVLMLRPVGHTGCPT
jgi:nucleotide-binding universal stress UspA family protein